MTTIARKANRPDYVFGTAEGWDAFEVARVHSVEEISSPFEFELTLIRLADKGPVDLDALINAPATLRIATEQRWRAVHGVVAAAEEIDRTKTLLIYRVVLAPHVVRAKHRRRCRNFVDKTLEEIIVTVLENRSPKHPNGNQGLASLRGAPEAPEPEPSFASFSPPNGFYRLALADDARINDATVAPYVVQYNESDFDFLSRLLEKEGISYTFEHTTDGVVMILTDVPGQMPLFERDTVYSVRTAWEVSRDDEPEFVRHVRDARRLRSSAVHVREWDWNRSHATLEALVQAGEGDDDALAAYQFFAEDENLASEPGAFAAQIRLERLLAEREMREGAGVLRSMEAGRHFEIQDKDQLRDDLELLAVRVETYATLHLPKESVLDDEDFGFPGSRNSKTKFESRFLALAKGTAFRPAMRTAKPRVPGVQNALVTAEEFTGSPPEINADKFGCVRVRFPWDQRANTSDGTPTSKWIRVSQYWAGVGFGSLHNPRVGHEVLVAFEHGDPDRPVIVGRVYNAQNPPPYDPSQEPTKSTVKSHSSPKSNGFNEIRFEDKAKKEEIFLHAQKDFNEVVLNCHSTSVGGDQSNSVGGNQSNSVTGNRTHSVKGTEDCTVDGARTHTVHGTECVTVDGDRATTFGSNETHCVATDRTTTIGAKDELTCTTRVTTATGSDSLTVGAGRTVTVTGGHTATCTGTYSSTANANHEFASTNHYIRPAGDFQCISTTAGFHQSASFSVNAAGASLKMSAGSIVLDNGAGAAIALFGSMVIVVGGPILEVASGTFFQSAGGAFTAKAPSMSLTGTGGVDVVGATIKLNG